MYFAILYLKEMGKYFTIDLLLNFLLEYNRQFFLFLSSYEHFICVKNTLHQCNAAVSSSQFLINAAKPDMLSFLFHSFFFLVKTWCLNHPQYSLTWGGKKKNHHPEIMCSSCLKLLAATKVWQPRVCLTPHPQILFSIFELEAFSPNRHYHTSCSSLWSHTRLHNSSHM